MTARTPNARPADRSKPGTLRRRLFQHGGLDITFTCLVLILFAIGVVMMYSASYATSVSKTGSPNTYFRQQLVAAAIGFAVMLLISKLDYRILNSIWAIIIYVGTILLLGFTLVYNILKGNTMKRWIPIPGFGQFQPSEVAKFALILILAYMICIFAPVLKGAEDRSTMPNLGGLTKGERIVFSLFDCPWKATVFMGMTALVIVGLVLLEKHLSATILLVGLTFAMLWAGGVKKIWFIVLGTLIVAAVVYVLYINPEITKVFGEYGYERIMVFREKDTAGRTNYWQTQQSLYAIGSGGPFGVGFGNSKQKQLWLPEPQNDFIFAIVVEELGYVGGMIIILLFVALVWRGFVIATRTRDYFGALLVIGIMMQVCFQVILNIAVVTDTIPNTGIGLPFFSYGGTALVLLLAEMGVVLSVSRSCTIEAA